jgi:hypothetical protein
MLKTNRREKIKKNNVADAILRVSKPHTPSKKRGEVLLG